MPASGVQAGEGRRLSDGRIGLPWLGERMPGEFTPVRKESEPLRTSVTDDTSLLGKHDSSLDVVIAGHSALNQQSLLNNHDLSPIESLVDASQNFGDDSVSPRTRPGEARTALPEQDRKLSQAVTDLERLMKEAIEVAISAAAQGRTSDVTEVLRDATDTIHRASVRSQHLDPSAFLKPGLDSDQEAQLIPHTRGRASELLVQSRRQPVTVTVEKVPDLPLPARAELVHEAPLLSASSLNLSSEEMDPPALPVAMVSSNFDNTLHEDDWSTRTTRRPKLPGTSYTPWTPKRLLTNNVDDSSPSSHKKRRADTMLTSNNHNDLLRARSDRKHKRDQELVATALNEKSKPYVSTRTRQGFGFGHHTRRQPIARKWSSLRKRFTATTACINTAFAGYIIGVYAGEVPRIQYQVVDPDHYIILGNVTLFLGLAVTTFTFWPLPLLHGRKPYTLGAFAVVLPLQFPQAIVVGSVRPPNDRAFHIGLLLSRLCTGLALGFANVNFLTTLLDLFGASLQSSNPHQELVIFDDVRRQGGGMGIWLGIWSWCFLGSIALGFLTGAGIIAHLNPQWGFYITCIVGVVVMLLNVMAPETRRSPYRRSFTEFIDEDEKLRRRIARGEVKLHLETESPVWWGEEVWAGVRLNFKMLFQRGFIVLAAYLGWTYALVVLVIVLLGSLLSRDYHWRPQFVGLGVSSIGLGAFLAIPMSKAGLFSKERTRGPRTDSMTFERQVTWSSHMVRRIIFMLVLPVAGVAYTLSSPGGTVHATLPILFAGVIGFFANLGIAECIGLVMETFDTSDLQPGVNSRHRFKSMASNVKRRRTNYSSFPRVTAGIFVSQTVGFLLAAAATGVGGVMTRTLSSQTATAITAAVLLLLTLLLTMVLWRFQKVQVIPNRAFGTRAGTFEWREKVTDEYWKPVIIGNPSGKTRKMNLLELGSMSRWTEVRRLNNLIKPRQT